MIHKADTLEQLYQAHMNTWSDMQHHMGILRYFSAQCESVAELGMRSGVSTTALLAGKCGVTSVDIERNDEAVKQLEWLCPDSFEFVQADSRKVVLDDDIDLMLFDSKHTYAHLNAELEFHAHRVERFMIFHDTCTFRHEGEDGTKPGLLAAIEPYYTRGPWKLLLDIDNCCGLMVLERG